MICHVKKSEEGKALFARRIVVCASLWALLNGAAVLWMYPETGAQHTAKSFFDHDRLVWVWIALAPVFWMIRFPKSRFIDDFSKRVTRFHGRHRWWLNFAFAMLIAATSLFASWRTSLIPFSPELPSTFASSPPLIHDEYSYLFQADTYLLGRLYNPSHPTMPELFDAMHILNEGKYVSRYFPGTGLWIAPFRIIGWPELGHWIASAASCVLVFVIGCELDGMFMGLIAGLLTACSPGMAIFSNLLLSHQPTLVGLLVATWAAVKLSHQWKYRDAFMTGAGLAYALLCRPLTAVAWGTVLVIWGGLQRVRLAGTDPSPNGVITESGRIFAVLVSPIVAALFFQAVCNFQITGDWQTTPYTQYQEIYTPCHRYGFDNSIRGAKLRGNKTLVEFDNWAENLTPALAFAHLEGRFWKSALYVLSPFVLTLVLPVFGVLAICLNRRYLLLPGLLISLHSVYFPYWFKGILDFHYVFETLPVAVLVVASVAMRLCRVWWGESRYLIVGWWLLLLLISISWNWVGTNQNSAIAIGLRTFSFSAERYRVFHATLKGAFIEEPAIVVVEPAPNDFRIEYIVNHPSLSADVIYVRTTTNQLSLSQIRQAFPNRYVYLIKAESCSVMRLDLTKSGASILD